MRSAARYSSASRLPRRCRPRVAGERIREVKEEPERQLGRGTGADSLTRRPRPARDMTSLQCAGRRPSDRRNRTHVRFRPAASARWRRARAAGGAGVRARSRRLAASRGRGSSPIHGVDGIIRPPQPQARLFAGRSMNRPTHAALLLSAALLAGAAAAQGAGTKSIGTPQGGRLLSLQELRACLDLQKDLAAGRPPLVQERSALDQERQALTKTEQALKDEQAKVEQLARLATDVGRRTKELQQRIADYNDRAEKFQNANLSGPTADRQRRAPDNDKLSIDQAAAKLDADRASLAGAEQLARDFNARAEARNRSVDDWNARNQALASRTQALQADDSRFKADCAGRSYREDDEKAILSGG